MQPLVAVVFAVLFEWGIAIQDLKLGRYFAGRKSGAELLHEAKPAMRKMGMQVLRDYLFFPLLAGPFFLTVLAGNAIANVMRNVWTYVVIFCGHFTAQAATFPKSVVGSESRGDWYLRQLQGSSNISGGPWLHFWTGNLSHQIEHHLYPDLPARRYAEIAPRVREVCERYGQVYNTGSFARQFGQVVWRILRYALPNDLRIGARRRTAGA
jgi:linoleoyl-CoA desaturase